MGPSADTTGTLRAFQNVADSDGITLEYIPTLSQQTHYVPWVSWRYDRTTEPWLHWFTRVGGAVLYGTASLVVVAGVAALVAVAVYESTAIRLLVVVLALVSGPLSLLYLLPVLGDTEQRQTLSLGENRVLTRRERVVVAVCGAATVTVTFVVDPRLVGGLLVVGLGSWLPAAVCASQGYLDPETATLATRYREWDLGAVTGFEARGIGPLTVITLDAAGSGATGRPPRGGVRADS